MESVEDDANSVLYEDQKFFKSDTIFVTFKSVTFEIFRKCSESVNFDANNDLQEDLKIFKSDTFENYKSFVPVEVQSLRIAMVNITMLTLEFLINQALIQLPYYFSINPGYDQRSSEL